LFCLRVHFCTGLRALGIGFLGFLQGAHTRVALLLGKVATTRARILVVAAIGSIAPSGAVVTGTRLGQLSRLAFFHNHRFRAAVAEVLANVTGLDRALKRQRFSAAAASVFRV
jgi:hypothetical protein